MSILALKLFQGLSLMDRATLIQYFICNFHHQVLPTWGLDILVHAKYSRLHLVYRPGLVLSVKFTFFNKQHQCLDNQKAAGTAPWTTLKTTL